MENLTLFGEDELTKRIFKSRQTGTPGRRFEAQVGTALIGFTAKPQVTIGISFGRKHRVDFVVMTNTGNVLVSAKWQQSRGSGEEKICFEVLRLAEAIRCRKARLAYVVTGGEGWTLRDFFQSETFRERVRGPGTDSVHVVTLDKFMSICNRGVL